MRELECYGIEDHELEPVGEDFDGVIYFRKDDVDVVLKEILEHLENYDGTKGLSSLNEP